MSPLLVRCLRLQLVRTRKGQKGFVALQICRLRIFHFPPRYVSAACVLLVINVLFPFALNCNIFPSVGLNKTKLHEVIIPKSVSCIIFKLFLFQSDFSTLLLWGRIMLHAWLTRRSHRQVVCIIWHYKVFPASHKHSPSHLHTIKWLNSALHFSASAWISCVEQISTAIFFQVCNSSMPSCFGHKQNI